MPVGERTLIPVKMETALDYDLETSLGKYGPFKPAEWILVFTSTFGVTGLLILIGNLLFGSTGSLIMAIFIFPIGWGILKIGVKVKKKVGHAWMWELKHRLGLVFNKRRHWPRPTVRRTYTGERKAISNAFTDTKNGGLMPSNEAELVYGVPEICEFNPRTNRFKKSITPRPRLNETYYIYEHMYQRHAIRTPHYFKRSIVPKDSDGFPAICNWIPIFAQIDTARCKNND